MSGGQVLAKEAASLHSESLSSGCCCSKSPGHQVTVWQCKVSQGPGHVLPPWISLPGANLVLMNGGDICSWRDKQLLGASLREAAIKAVLQRLALLLRLLHGPMDALLAKVTLSPHHVRHFARQAA